MRAILFLLLFLLAGCAEMPVASVGPAPSQAMTVALVNEYMRKAFPDPYSVMDLSIEPPVLKNNRWVIYFTSNSKNMMGGYTGIQRCKILLKDNQIDWPEQQLEIVREQDGMPI
jgi:hypothetical protein